MMKFSLSFRNVAGSTKILADWDKISKQVAISLLRRKKNQNLVEN